MHPDPELTEGPFYIDVDSIRSDIREDRQGVPLRLAIRVRDAESCEPIRNAVVDIWQCDAGGQYSGVEGDETFLRGAQVTNSAGIFDESLVLASRPEGDGYLGLISFDVVRA